MTDHETRLVGDAIYQLNNGYPLGALSILRGLVAEGAPRAPFTPTPREAR